ncbi:protein of unknown function [Magnetospirillum sp. XM-1]|uniref:hypothetical protein n=1 Tax=Magnetospirillum sp. XM-1 TaxID=1663591 RepID=UPI00073DEE90|nr:hypothetical protein [Magnetospirillum sp. XM-1]CUW38793.1 protein of unknown function [Magnetospirillum sp. XM-1]
MDDENEINCNDGDCAPTQGHIINRDTPDVPDARKKLVKKWNDRVIAAKERWKDDFDRMREDQDLAYGYQWSKSLDPEQYQANLIQRHIQQRVAALYAKNPKAVARRKERLDFTQWDGHPGSLAAANQAGQMALATATQQPMAMLAQPQMMQQGLQAAGVLMDVQQGVARRQMLDKLSKTLELIYAYYIDEQTVPFKASMKQLVRRAVTCGVAYVKLDFQRIMEQTPEVSAKIADLSERLSTMERLAADIADDEVRTDSAEAEQLKLAITALAAEPQVIIREGLLFDFPASTAIIPDPKTKRLSGFVGGDWVAEEYLLSVDDVKEIFRIDVGKDYTGYQCSTEGSAAMRRSDEDTKSGKGDVCVWQIHSRKDGLVYWVADGYPDFLREPTNPNVKLERFWPYFVLTFNEVEHETKLFPPSDVTILRPMQREYNRAREGIREHRIANRPATAVAANALSEEDVAKLQSHPANAVLELQALLPGQKVDDLLQPLKGPPIDPNVYEVKFIFEDILKTVGAQEANFGGTASATATESSIAEGSRMSAMASAVDELDDMLSEIAKASGQVLLMEVSEDTVKQIVGPGAVWPQLTREEIISDVYLEIEAGSSGRPNKAAELQNFQMMAPYLMQLPNLNPEWLLREMVKRLDDKLDLSDAYSEGMPSIMAQNSQKQVGTGDPTTDPNQQGPQGVQSGGPSGPKAQEGSNRDPNVVPMPQRPI